MKLIADLVHDLATAKTFANTTNQYSFDEPANSIRRDNLFEYLSALYLVRPTVLLVSEAPGYNGMRRTGIPFSSERIVLAHPFFQTGQFGVEDPTDTRAEPSATIVWSALDKISTPVLMWPSFPFHPHRPENKDSNRVPTRNELLFGQQFLQTLIRLFRIEITVAIGRKAELSLHSLGYRPAYVRHPAQGGASDFRAGLTALFREKTRCEHD